MTDPDRTDRMQRRILEQLRLNPDFVESGSIRLVPFKDKLMVTWTGMALLERSDMDALYAPEEDAT